MLSAVVREAQCPTLVSQGGALRVNDVLCELYSRASEASVFGSLPLSRSCAVSPSAPMS